MRNFKLITTFFIVLGLSACTTITRRIEAAANTPSAYTESPTNDIGILKNPSSIDLSTYKSEETRPGQRSDIAVAVAVSGGGYRAANFAAGVLMGLEQLRSPDLKGNMLQEVDYFSSVSGGGFAVGYYLTNLYNYEMKYAHNPKAAPFSFTNLMEKVIKSDSGPAIMSRNPLAKDYADLLFFGNDRGLLLENDLNKSILMTPNGGLTLGDIFVPKGSSRQVMLPYWTTNTTIYQNSAMFPIAPDTIKRYKVRGYWHDHHQYQLQGSFDDPNYADPFPVSVGMTASASVPFVFPTTTLTSQACANNKHCYLQLLDGGLSDNMGIFSALGFLYDDPAKTKILIIIDAANNSNQPFSKSLGGPTGFPLLWQLFNMSTDALHAHIREYINFTARDILCTHGASHVVVVYIALAQDQQARKIGTSFSIQPSQQKYLIHLGEKVTLNNAVLKKLMKSYVPTGISIGQCPGVRIAPSLFPVSYEQQI